MPTSADDIVVFDAIKTNWMDQGLDAVVPNGIFWGDVLPGTKVPYCEFSVMGVRESGRSNKSQYREYSVQFKVNHTDQALAGELVKEIANRMEDVMFVLPLGEGSVYRVDRTVLNFVRIDEVTWAAFVNFVINRCVPRTRTRTQESS